ncbi:class I SAM-dependent RNA methyltransferase [Candidatus Peregrinibacteria bacterium]|nr:MAG: class I SAM-dependent RNA methyltransferase [Candidatus Peregrinibacteria bacterium]
MWHGNHRTFCAHKARRVFGVEMNEAAVESARSNAARNGIQNVSFYLGSVEERLSELSGLGPDAQPDVVIVDPPRAGLGEKVVADCVAFAAPKIVYVSCNPTTLARDLKQFAEMGYETKSVQPVDMFPQTHHVECVSVLLKNPL